ncbi:MAG: RNA polymerase subunit sigma [Planctomycetes bacterium]|nr:RNA polymerase subunit sigma [Planctomycetota bacterium]
MDRPDCNPSAAATERDPVASGKLFALLYDDLRCTARRLFRAAPWNSDLQTTALVHEAWIRLGPEGEQRFAAQRAFVVAITKTMRSILVDSARSQGRIKRGGDRVREPLDDVLAVYEASGTHVLDLCEALAALAAIDVELAELAELHLIGGLGLDDIALLRAEPRARVARDWDAARRWLARRMRRGEDA